MKRVSRGGATPRIRAESALVIGFLAGCLSGCSSAVPVPVRLNDDVRRPERAVLLISIDGVDVDVFDDCLAAGELPNVKARLIDRGVRVREAVASHPTITYANFATILTGRYAGHHGIVGNKWFDRNARLITDYTTIGTYRWVGDDYLAPTLFERLKPARSVSIQNPNRRGADRIIDNWATAGALWFLGKLESVDRLQPARMEIVVREANAWGEWPTFIHVYFPGTDEIGHRCGADCDRYRQAIINVDGQIGRLLDAVDAVGMADRTYVALLSDHGHVPVPPDKSFGVVSYLEGLGLRVLEKPTKIASFEQRKQYFGEIDAVVVNGGDRRTVVHLPGDGGWHERPSREQLFAVLDPPGADPLWMHPAIDLLLTPGPGADGHRTVDLYSRHGHSRFRRFFEDGIATYAHEAVDGDAFAGVLPTGWHDAEQWLALTVDGPYPDVVVPIVELFDSPRAGDIMLVATEGWDFTPGSCGGHGGLLARDMRVPMIFAGPGLPAAATIDHMRLVDVSPTLLGLLGVPANPHPRTFDGRNRSDELRNATANDEAALGK